MSSEVHFHYELTGAGWSECRFSVDGSRCELTASYLSDALGELAAAVEDVLRWPNVDARAVFAEEPGEYRWRFLAAGEHRVVVKIIEFSEWRRKDDSAGNVIFEAECRRYDLGRAMADELRRLHGTLGERGYREKWVNHEFPTARLAAIEDLLLRAAS
jgi:hypothetical protein